MKNIGLLLVLLSIVTCGEKETKTEIVTIFDSSPYETLSNEEKNEALITASKNGQIEIVQYLVENGANINAQDSAYYTALMKASGDRQLEVIKYLIEKGASVTIDGEAGWTALDSALVIGGENLEVVKILVENGADLNTGILNFVSRTGYLEAVKVLVENGADINRASNEFGDTPLIEASREGKLEVVKYLVKAGADISAVDEFMQTTLDHASAQKHTEIVEYLENINTLTAELFKAVIKGDLESVQQYIKNGASVNTSENNGDTVLIYASQIGNSEIAKLLLENGANVDARSEFGTALEYASRDGHLEIVKLLVEQGAESNTPASERFLHEQSLATQEGHTEIVEYLSSIKTTEDPAETAIADLYKSFVHDDILTNKDAFIKANDFYGYKGDVTVTVDWYEEDYAAEGGSTNIGVVYKAYLDFVSPENQKVIFYESKHAPELEINIVNNSSLTFHETNTTSTVFYEKKKIYDSAMSSEEKSELTQNVPLYKYPYNFWGYIYYGGEPTSLQNLISPEKSAQSYLNCAERDGYDPFDDYSVKITIDAELRITAKYMGDNGDSFTWKNGVVHKKFIGIMGEGITIEFLDEKGWLRRNK